MSDDRIARAGITVAAGTLTSRILGILRAMLLAHAIGATGLAANAFATASQIPNTVYTLIITGALTAVLVPQITKAALKSDGGQQYINRLVTLAILGTAALLPIMALATPWLIEMLGTAWNNPQQTRIATLFAWWLIPQILFYSLYTVVGEVLNAKSLFWPYAWTPVINNVVNIIGMVAFIWLYGSDPEGSLLLDRWDPLAVFLLAGSATIGVAVQGIALFAFWKRVGLKFRFDARFRGIGLGTMGKVAFWMFLTVLIAQLVGLVYTAILNIANKPDEAGYAAWQLVHLIAVMPHSVIVLSLVTTNFTRMSERIHAGDIEAMKVYLVKAARIAIFAMVFVIVTISVLAMPVIRVLQPKAPHINLEIFAPLLIVTMFGMLAHSLLFVINRGFFALSDTRRPFFISVACSALALVGGLLCMLVPTQHLASALSLSNGLVTVVQVIVTFLVLRKIVGLLQGRKMMLALAQTAIAAAIAAAAGVGVLVLLGGTAPTALPVASFAGAIVTAIAVSITMAVIYVAVLVPLRNTEAREIAATLRRVISRVRR